MYIYNIHILYSTKSGHSYVKEFNLQTITTYNKMKASLLNFKLLNE